jgi:hypothetical protein
MYQTSGKNPMMRPGARKQGKEVEEAPLTDKELKS